MGSFSSLTTLLLFISTGISTISSQWSSSFPANERDFSFHAGLVDPQEPEKIVCSASIISRNLILTTSHCVEGLSEIKAIFGVHQYPLEEEPSIETRTYQQKDVLRNPLTRGGGLVLLRSDDPLRNNGPARPIQLPRASLFERLNGLPAVMSFWAQEDAIWSLQYVYTGFSDAYFSGPCLHIDTPVHTIDSGSPIFYEDEFDTQRLIAVYSQGNNATKSQGVHYISLEPYLDWISLQVQYENGL